MWTKISSVQRILVLVDALYSNAWRCFSLGDMSVESWNARVLSREFLHNMSPYVNYWFNCYITIGIYENRYCW